MVKKAAMLWTGGKDSSLSLYEAKLLGYDIQCLITFIPKKPKFLAHPLNFMKYQATALDIPHYTFEIIEPFKANYKKAIQSLKNKYHISTLITGDIAEVNNEPNWIRECCKDLSVNVLTPLWGTDRRKLIDRLLSYKFKIIFSLVKKPWFTVEWLGREIDKNSLEELEILSMETGLDVCGENGEYHTLALDGPIFQKSIRIDKYSKEAKDSLIYMDIQKVSVV